MLPVPELATHTQQVQSLYKMAIRNLESWYDRREVFRYMARLMRARFDRNKSVQNYQTARELLRLGHQELFYKSHWHIRKPPNSPYGSAYERDVPPPDWAIDYWHPLEKAQYPTYFAKREELKKKYIALWKDLYSES
ncbi:Complex 1 protein (LYR family) [Popillia japonica]|uniref:NADH dehydrogenase [ubiquinone] 1 beta subcomplex subunit 9 n=1 Tax=Popillia japonica TaxID=7064 RepID=A0AAW1LRI1_POPJA